MKNITSIKLNKLFGKNDLILYAFLVVLIFMLFLFFAIIPSVNADENKDGSKGFTAYYNNEELFSFFYEEKTFSLKDDKFSSLILTEEKDGFIYINIYTDDSKKDFNTLKVDYANNCVSVCDSSCFNKYCVNMEKITDKGVIYCAPHKLKITPYKQSGFVPPVAGGV